MLGLKIHYNCRTLQQLQKKTVRIYMSQNHRQKAIPKSLAYMHLQNIYHHHPSPPFSPVFLQTDIARAPWITFTLTGMTSECITAGEPSACRQNISKCHPPSIPISLYRKTSNQNTNAFMKTWKTSSQFHQYHNCTVWHHSWFYHSYKDPTWCKPSNICGPQCQKQVSRVWRRNFIQ